MALLIVSPLNMSRDFYRNRSALGSIPQMPSIARIPGALTKLIEFNSAVDLTDNFNSTLGSGATQAVTGGVLQFRNSQYDKQNEITQKFTVKFFDEVELRLSHTASSTDYWYPNVLTLDVVDASGTKIKEFRITNDIRHTYNQPHWIYYNSGYVYWMFDTDNMGDSNAAYAKRLVSASSGYHTWKVVDNKNGTVNVYRDGTIIGTNLSLGNATYRLGKKFVCSPLDGWNNNQKYGDLDWISFKYTI